MSWKLGRTKQCAKCPWKVSTNPNDIPDGYTLEKHKALRNTIADPSQNSLVIPTAGLNIMACHEHSVEEEVHCIGWLHNQVNSNNILLRLDLINCDNVSDIEIVGEQHPTFDDTLPKDK